MNCPICVDASVVVRLVVDALDSERVHALWTRWQAQGRVLVAPSLLYYEVANALFRYEQAGELTGEEGQQALGAALTLPVELSSGAAVHVEAVLLARRLGLKATYDAHYLALAERLGAEFWTADRRLARQVAPSLPWVREIGSIP